MRVSGINCADVMEYNTCIFYHFYYFGSILSSARQKLLPKAAPERQGLQISKAEGWRGAVMGCRFATIGKSTGMSGRYLGFHPLFYNSKMPLG